MKFWKCNYANESHTQGIWKCFTLRQLMSVPKRDELCPFGDLQFVWDFRSHSKCLGMRKFSHISEKSYAGGFETCYIFITITQSCSLAHSQQWVWVPVSHSIPWSSSGTCPSVWMPQFLLLNWLWYTWQHPKMTAWVQTYTRVSIAVPLWLLAYRKIFSYSLHVFILEPTNPLFQREENCKIF